MTIKNLLYLISFLLLVSLFFNSLSQIDFGATINNHLLGFKKQDVENMSDIDSVKSFAKHSLEQHSKSISTASGIAVNRIYMILGLVLIQILIIVINRPANKKQIS